MKRVLLGMLAAMAALAWPAVAMADIAGPVERHAGLIWVLVIAVVVIAAVVLFFVLKKKKK